MKRFDEYRTEAGPKPELVPSFHTYFAYLEGKAIECQTSDEARKISKNWEPVIANKDEVNASRLALAQWEAKAAMLWKRDLFAEFAYQMPKNLTQPQLESLYNQAYSKAYEDGHAAGYDEVANYMIENTDFILETLKAVGWPM